jgi:hypothetical protein
VCIASIRCFQGGFGLRTAFQQQQQAIEAHIVGHRTTIVLRASRV